MRHQRGSLAAHPGRVHVQQRAAADGHDRRVRPHHEAVARQGYHRRLEPQADERALARLERRAIEKEHAGHHLAGPDVEPDAVARLQGSRRVGQELERSVDRRRRDQRSRQAHHIAPLEGRTLEPLKVHRRALAGVRFGDGLAMGLQAADLRLKSARKHLDAVVDSQAAGGQRPGHDGPEALDGEHTIDRQARELVRRARGDLLG